MRLVTAATAKPVSTSEMKEVLYITGTSDHDTRISLALDAAIAKVEADTRRILAPTVFSERFEAVSQKIVKVASLYYHQIWLGVGPITAVGSALVDGASVSTALWLITTGPYDYAVYAPQGLSGDLFIQFTAGYATCPNDLKRAVILLAAAYFKDPITSQSADDVAGYAALIGPYKAWVS
jgi:uncharacterized phiE125 gp8 family phage protein